MGEFLTYMVNGYVVTFFMIWFYRHSKWQSEAERYDALGGLIGPFVWPLQIVAFIVDGFRKE